MNPSVKPPVAEAPNLRLVAQTATVDMPVNATVRIPESVWKRAKIAAISRGITLAELVQAAIESDLARGESKPKRNRGGDE